MILQRVPDMGRSHVSRGDGRACGDHAPHGYGARGCGHRGGGGAGCGRAPVRVSVPVTVLVPGV